MSTLHQQRARGKKRFQRQAAPADIISTQECREGGTASVVPFQDRDHGKSTDRFTMIFFLRRALRPQSLRDCYMWEQSLAFSQIPRETNQRVLILAAPLW